MFLDCWLVTVMTLLTLLLATPEAEGIAVGAPVQVGMPEGMGTPEGITPEGMQLGTPEGIVPLGTMLVGRAMAVEARMAAMVKDFILIERMTGA